MSQAMQAGDIKGIRDILTQRFPGLQFETMDTELEEVDKPTEVAAAPAPGTDVTGETEKEQTTASLFGDYMAGLPGGVRELVTTDYKGTRGGRLGRGNYSTASIIPGAQVATPAPVTTPSTPTSSAAAAPSYTTTTYNYTYNYPQEQQVSEPTGQIETGPVSEPDVTPPTATGGFTPAWAKASSQKATTAKKAGAGKVASTTDRGAYVAPSSSAAPATAQRAFTAVETAVARGGSGVQAAAKAGGDPGKIGANAAAALVAGGGRSSAKQALQKAERGKIELTNQARKALEKAAEKKKK